MNHSYDDHTPLDPDDDWRAIKQRFQSASKGLPTYLPDSRNPAKVGRGVVLSLITLVLVIVVATVVLFVFNDGLADGGGGPLVTPTTRPATAPVAP